jgi:hypothetical protein
VICCVDIGDVVICCVDIGDVVICCVDIGDVVICYVDVGDVVIDHTQGDPVEHSESERDVEVHQICAHCVIIAARCDWFRRALLSGMRESIDK